MSRWRVPRALVLLGAIACSVAACGDDFAPPRAQWLVRVQTDAPIPQFGDRILIELLDDEGELACSECRRTLGIREKDQLPLSFGIADPGRAGLRLRVRMFRADHSTAGGRPRDGLPLDFVGTMPLTGGGVRRIRVDLRLACAGLPADLSANTTCGPDGAIGPLTAVADDDGGLLAPSALTASEPCTDVPATMVCVPGTVFALGQSREIFDVDPRRASSPERLTKISSFAMDRTEMTVGELRPLVRERKVTAPITHNVTPACNYTTEPGEYERFPVNCVTWDDAAAACEALGKRLPTEAEWELAAGNGSDETTYPWGESDDVCSYAIIGRGRTPFEGGDNDISLICRNPGNGAPPLPWGSVSVDDGTDVNKLGIRHLGGNVAEYTADFSHAYTECFADAHVLVNPRCSKAPPGTPPAELVTYRGSNWQERAYNANITVRSFAPGGAIPYIGFRCVRGGGGP